jgi:hypothetical protein
MNVIERQVQAYNKRSLEEFVGCYTENIVIEDDRGTRFAEGHAGLRAMYGPLFQHSPDLKCEILHRSSIGDYTVDEEHVTGAVLDGFPPEIRAIVAYRVEGDMISHVRVFW